MPHLTRARASAFALFLAIAAALLGFAAGAALAKDPSGRADGETSAAAVPDSAPQSARQGQTEDQFSVADTASDVARYAVDASREASRATETTLRTMGSALSEAGLVVRRETGRVRAAALRAREAIDEATDQRSRSQVISPRGARGVRRAQAEASFARGSRLLEARKYREARDRFAEAVALTPEYDRARAMLAWSQYFLGDFRGAVGSFKTALARQPTWEGLSNGLGWSRLRIGHYQLAADAFREAPDRNPDYVDAWNGLGSALFEGGERADARTAFQRADRLGPNDEIVREGLRRASL